jgi:hypothetical protein
MNGGTAPVNPEHFRELLNELERAGLSAQATALRDALFNTAYTSSSEFIGEMDRVIAAIARASGAVPAPVNQALARSLEEVHKIWPAFG